jgi:hypothetical protein
MVMERYVRRQNIEDYEQLLKTVAAPAQRRVIEKLLSEEEAKLKQVEEDQKNNPAAL